MTDDNVAQLNEELERVRKLLDEKSAEKEKSYQKRQSLRGQISQEIGQVKELKAERNAYTSKVQELKETKSTKIADQKKTLDELKSYQKQIRDAQPAGGRKVHPDRLLQQIERLEYVIETEALSPKKEQEMMDKIRQFKTEYEQVKGSDDVYAKYREVRAHFTNLNREISEVKKLIQNNADISQEHHVKMLEVSKHIDELKEQLDELDKEYQERRTEYLKVLDEFRGIKEKLGIAVPQKRNTERANRKAAAEARTQAENTKLASKQEDVYDKIKNKQKLTTEDLLILQNAESRGIKQESEQEKAESSDAESLEASEPAQKPKAEKTPKAKEVPESKPKKSKAASKKEASEESEAASEPETESEAESSDKPIESDEPAQKPKKAAASESNDAKPDESEQNPEAEESTESSDKKTA